MCSVWLFDCDWPEEGNEKETHKEESARYVRNEESEQ